jgi:predicted nucleic-acid-binding Zn-ribbon protein
MRTCPKCRSTNVSKEKWHDAVPNAFELGGSAALGQTGDLICNDCKYTSTPSAFVSTDKEQG